MLGFGFDFAHPVRSLAAQALRDERSRSIASPIGRKPRLQVNFTDLFM